ncbi:hypothetical protein BDQ17DRAFT_1538991 [Cyathus striatus]|nr:hypothetical protein BDQ17DRAFT_1538991 [Cyathus striatus]
MVTKRKTACTNVTESTDPLKKLKTSDEVVEDNEDSTEQVYNDLQELDNMNMQLLPQLLIIRPNLFSCATDKMLEKLNIHKPSSWASLVPYDYSKRLEICKMKGEDQLWSSRHLYHHLQLINKIICSNNERAVSRVWIEAFLFRASAMVPEGQGMFFSSDNGLAYSYYTVCVGDSTDMEVCKAMPHLIERKICHAKTFVVIGFDDEQLSSDPDRYIPQAVWRLYWTAKKCGKNTIRGALSNGPDWIFLILSLNEDGSASYQQSCSISASFATEPFPDVISGIISHWAQKCYCNLDEDDWFPFITTSGVDIRTISAN